MPNSSDELFNRPPRTRHIAPSIRIRLPNMPSAQRRNAQSLTPILSSVSLIIASVLVANMTGRSLIYMIPMLAGSGIFMVIAVVQMVRGALQARKDRTQYRKELSQAIVALISAHGEQQYIASLNDPPPTPDAVTDILQSYQTTQNQQISHFLHPLAEKHSTGAVLYPPSAWRFPNIDAPPLDRIPCLLDIVGWSSVAKGSQPMARLWERRPDDEDFLSLRFGQGRLPSNTQFERSSVLTPPPEHQHIEEAFRDLCDVPLTCSLPSIGSLGIAGSLLQRVTLTHALIWQIIIHHAPTDVRIAGLYSDSRAWSWIKWLPHTIPLNGERTRRMLAATPRQHEQLLVTLLNEFSQRREGQEQEKQPAVVLFVDAPETVFREPALRDLLRIGKSQRIYIIVLVESWNRVPSDCGAMLRWIDDTHGQYAPATQPWSSACVLDRARIEHSELLARSLAPLAATDISGEQEIPQTVRLLDLLMPSFDGEMNCLQLWHTVPERAWHPDIPIGQGSGGQPRYLNLNEHCDGPHGIIAGKTGAGKSELLQAIIASIVMTHAPDRAQLFLIDFKGGASLRMFSSLPHTVGFVTDLQDSRLAERAIIALKRELRRRKDILNEADVKDISAYRALLEPPPPLANLLVVIDEFDSMVTNQPGFVTELVSVVKQGRSLGVHLLLATQQPSLAVKDEIKTQLQYWLALRLGSAQDSRDMLQRPDAAFLPGNIPGRAYLRVGTGLSLFQAARVSGLYQPTGSESGTSIFEIDETGQIVPLDAFPSTQSKSNVSTEQFALTDLDIIVQHVKDGGKDYAYVASPVWCPPLTTVLPLSHVLNEATIRLWKAIISATSKIALPDTSLQGQIKIPFGMIDLPEDGVQIPTMINLQQGHISLFGAPGSGKTMFLRSTLTSLALMYRPDDIWCYIVDAGGQGLQTFNGLPHIGAIVSVRDIEAVRRLIWMVLRELKQRSIDQKASEESQNMQHAHPAILLIIDKFLIFRQEYEQFNIIDDLITLASQGRSYDIHLILTADRPGDIPFRLQGLIDTRIVLRMADDNDSLTLMGRRDAASIASQFAGRGYRLTQEHGWAEIQVAIAHSGFEDSGSHQILDADIANDTRKLVQGIKQLWESSAYERKHRPPAVRLLPTHIVLADVLRQTIDIAAPRDQRVRIAAVGLEGQSLGNATITLGPRCPVLLVTGGPRSGKTNTLHVILRCLAQRYTPNQIKFALIDPRGSSLLSIEMGDHQPFYASSETELVAMTQVLSDMFSAPLVDTHCVVVIDDYELGATLLSSQFNKPYGTTTTRNFFQLLEWLLSKGREYGCSLIVATQSTTPTGFISALNAGRNGFIMRPNEYPPATNLLGVKLPVPLIGQSVAGRAIQVLDGVQQWVQIADAHMGSD